MLKSPTEIGLVIALAVLITYVFTRSQGKSQIIMAAPPPMMSAGPSAPPIIVKGGDDRYTRAPRPQRVWDNGPELPTRGVYDPLEPIATRGAPEAYQQMGVLTTHDGKALPLYGRRTAPRSDYFNYYTRTDTYNPVALPVSFKKRDCQDNAGCAEVMSGDELRLAATGQEAKVTLYGFDGPRYVG
jgi:hypothetical protein